MTEVVAPPRRKLSGWQLREKFKSEAVGNSRDEFNQSGGTASTTSLQASDRGDEDDLPPAFRSLTAGQKIRRLTSLKPTAVATQKAHSNIRKVNSLRPPTTQEMDRGEIPVAPPSPIKENESAKAKQRARAVAQPKSKTKEPAPTISQAKSGTKKAKSASLKEKEKAKAKGKNKTKGTETKKKSKSLPDETTLHDAGTAPGENEVSLPVRRLPKLNRRERSETRKSSVLDSLGKFEPTHSFTQRALPKRGNSAALKRNPYASKAPEASDEMSVQSLSLDSLPPPEREQRTAQSLSDKFSLGRSTSSFEASLDLSGHRMLPVYEQITTSATDEQWARFKLLGRLGLGDIKLSPEAEALVDRNYGIMLNAIKHIYALRGENDGDVSLENINAERVLDIRTGHLLEEVQATISVPTEGPSRLKRDPNTIEVDPEVQRQLRDYVLVISSMYRDNAFHNFEHASNVLLNVDRLIGIVRLPDSTTDYRNLKHGYGVATEPWNHFALVFAAMIHDVDHNGVPNAQLIKERAHVAGAYKNKSVAEQNSIELAWNLLMEPCYKELRESIFHFRSELTNFRSLVVTAVMATDIADKELAALRKGRAADALKAEEDDISVSQVDMDLVRRKATFVVETLIQVADVSHTMSSFSVFKKWNHRLYRETYKAYKDGRAEQDPTDTWYKGEFGFFDFYVIPLSKKLKDCGIYGEESEQYLKNAIENRRLWEEKGEELVAKYIEERDAEEAAGDNNESSTVETKRAESVKAPGPPEAKKISLREMAEWVSSSESESGDDFAEDDSDDDSVSISDGSGGSRRRDTSHSCRAPANLASMRDYLKAMSTGGKIPSKASLDMKNDRRLVYRSKAAELEDMLQNGESGTDDRQAKGMRIRVRSRSPASAPDMRFRQRGCSPGSVSGGSDPSASLRSRTRSRSPLSGSEHSEPKPILKHRPLSQSPGSERSRRRSILKNPHDSPLSGSEHSETKANAMPRSRSRSPSSTHATIDKVTGKMKKKGASPASQQKQSRDQRQSSRSGKLVRRGRRPSRSRSPASNADRVPEETTEMDVKRGKRPAKIKGRSK